MRRTIARLVRTAGFAVSLAALAQSGASAATFQVSPLSLDITKFGDVTVTNTSDEPIRFSVNGYAWSQTPAEKEHRAQSEDLVYFPQVFSLGPGASQRIRVGIDSAGTSMERAFRFFISELPPFDRNANNGQHLLILSRIDIPVFQPPVTSGSPVPRIQRIGGEGSTIAVLLVNDGTEHTAPSHVNVIAHDASGARVWSGGTDVWYVLAKSQQRATLSVPSSTCARIRSVTASWTVEGQTVSQTADTPGLCP